MNTEELKFQESNNSSESESEIQITPSVDFTGVSVTGTDWTIETVLSQLTKGNIELNPRFQRRDAWEATRKCHFIESLFLGLPVPQIVLAERRDARGKYIVLDGKQRLLCLRQFTAKADDKNFNNFKLTDLTIRKDLNEKSYSDIENDIALRGDITAFENQTLRTVVVRNWKNEGLLFLIFIRLNLGSKPLSPQELRQALHPGPFLDYADEASVSSKAIRRIFDCESPDFRMRDVELIIRFLGFVNFIADYKGNLKEFLDYVCQKLNAEWASYKEIITNQILQLDEADQLLSSAMCSIEQGYKYNKWMGSKFEGRFNRAVFDVLSVTAISPPLMDALRNRPTEVALAFKQLCKDDKSFLEAIERTTKSLSATRYRYKAWVSKLNASLGLNIQDPGACL
jgi:hypothetical protein